MSLRQNSVTNDDNPAIFIIFPLNNVFIDSDFDIKKSKGFTLSVV